MDSRSTTGAVNLRWLTADANRRRHTARERIPSLDTIVARLFAEHVGARELEAVPF